MSGNYVLRQVQSGRMPADWLCLLAPVLARQQDPEAPQLLNLIDKLSLWRRWGFADLASYVVKTGVPVSVFQCSTALMLCDDRGKAEVAKSRSACVKEMVAELFNDGPATMPNKEFYARMDRICEELDKG